MRMEFGVGALMDSMFGFCIAMEGGSMGYGMHGYPVELSIGNVGIAIRTV